MKLWQADAAIIGGGALWGTAFIFTRWGLGNSPPALFFLGRLGLALIVTAILFGRRLRGISRRTARRGLILGLLMGGHFLAKRPGRRDAPSDR